MGFTIVYFAGRVLRHIGGILLLCWRRMIWVALMTGGVALVVAEIGGSSVTHQIPAPLPAQIAAILFAIGLGYGAALTALLAEISIGALETIRLLEGDAEAGARAAAVIGERAGGELSGFVGWVDAGAVAIMRMLKGRSASTQPVSARHSSGKQRLSSAASQGAKPNRPQKGSQGPAALAQRPPLEFQRGAASGGAYTRAAQSEAQVEIVTLNLETLADIAATEEFINTSPRPKVNARPVAANQLPRIEWAYEKVERERQNTADAPASAPHIAPLEWQAPADGSPVSSEVPAAPSASIAQREAEEDTLPETPNSDGV